MMTLITLNNYCQTNHKTPSEIDEARQRRVEKQWRLFNITSLVCVDAALQQFYSLQKNSGQLLALPNASSSMYHFFCMPCYPLIFEDNGRLFTGPYRSHEW